MMKKLLVIVLSAAIALSIAACGTGGNPTPQDSDSQSDVQVPNLFTDCDTLADAAREAGFELTVPDAVNGAADRLIRVADSKMIEVIYQTSGNEAARIRKALGDEDISGDFNEYAQTDTTTVGEAEVTMRGSDDMVYLATWTAGGYTYAASVADGISSSDMEALVSEIH